MSDLYLVHYGIKGQKHGQRRFQNEDGSLTEAGRARYGVHSRHKTTASGSVQAHIGGKVNEHSVGGGGGGAVNTDDYQDHKEHKPPPSRPMWKRMPN